MNYRIGQLILTPTSKNNTISEVFVAEPDSEKEALAGKIFILLEIETKRSDGLKLANFLINYINNSYYQNEKLVLKEKIPSLRIEHIFESVVSRANNKILEFIKEENIKITTNSLNSTIGLLYNNEIHFSTAGKNRALLIYKKIQEGNKLYKTIDLNKNNGEDDDKGSKEKLFNNVISGTIPSGSTFIFSNEALPEYLSPKQLSDITTTLPPTSAVEQIKNTLSQINEYISFIGIVIKSSRLDVDEKTEETKKIQQTEDSVSRLNDTEESTENILSPSGNIKIQTYFKSFYALVVRLLSRDKNNETLFIKTSTKLNSRALKFYLNKFITFLKSLSINIVNFLFYIFKSFGNIKNLKESFHSTKNFLLSLFSYSKNNTLQFKKRYKIILVLFLISILGFSYELNNIKKAKIAEEAQIQYEETKETIDLKLNQSEANLLYNNEDNAKELFSEIRDLFSNFPQATEEQKNDYASFTERFNKQLDKVRKVVKIPEESSIVNFSDINKNSKVKNIILESGNIYASDPDQNSIYIFNIENKLTTTVTDLNNKLENIDNPSLNSENTIYWYSPSSIIKLNTDTEEIFSIDLNKEPDSNIVDMASYNQRTYMLDNNLSQIYRYEKGDDGFNSYSKWINNESNLKNAISLDIDGYIYVLENTGTIHKYLKGNEESFIQDIIEPPLTSADKIKVSQENDFIYLLDSSNSRIVIFNKEGKFIEQQQSNNLENISDFIVDENNQKFYILSENQIYSIDMTNL